MGRSELQTSTNYWTARAQKYQAAGIPAEVWKPIALKDMTSTYQLGSSPMTNETADVAVYSAWKGSPAVAKQPPHHGGLFGGLETILGNVVHDTGGIITGLPRGVAHLAGELVTPSTYTTAGKDLSQALSDVGDPGKALRDLQSSPLLDLIPGVDVAAKLTTGAGRTSLEEHPVSALLDILPITKPLSAVAGASLAARAGGELGAASEAASLADKLRGIDLRSSDPSGLAALMAGRPVQAAARGIDRAGLARLAGGRTELGARAGELGLGPGQYVARRGLARANLDQVGKSASRILHQGQLGTVQEVHDFTTGELAGMFKELGTADRKGNWQPNMEAINAFTEKATLGDLASMTPEEAAVYERLAQWRADEQARLVESGQLAHVPGYGHYNPDSQVVKRWKALAKAKAKEERERAAAVVKHGRELTRSRASVDRTVRTAEQARDRLVRATARQRPGLAAPKGTLPDWVERGQTLEAKHALAVKARDEAKAGHEQLAARGPRTAEHEAAKAGLTKASTKFDKAIVVEPPAHLQPWIKTTLAQRAVNAVKARDAAGKGPLDDHIDPEHVGQLRAIGDIHAVFKWMEQTPMMMGRLQTYLGDDEFKKLVGDTVQEALRRQSEGFAPLYIHHIAQGEMARPSEVRMAQVRDLKEAQLKQKLLDGGTSVMNMWVAMTREGVNSAERHNMQQAWDAGFAPHTKTTAELEGIYQRAHARLEARGKLKPGQTWLQMLGNEWVKVDFDRYGIRHTSRSATAEDTWLPKELARNLETAAGENRTSGIFEHGVYRAGMKVFRTSVLYGPRHFAHVVIGGIMPLLLDSPSALAEIPAVWRIAHNAARGQPFTGEVRGEAIPAGITSPFDYKVDAATKYMNQAVGETHARILKDFWEKTGAKPGEKLAQWEHSAQMMYQLAVFSRDLRKSVSPVQAAEHARRLVVNLDEMSPLERTVFKQIMPFYSFTRFATRFLAHLPFDHPLRVAVLSRLSNQATEEWGSGLPMTMMSLFYFGHPNAAGNQWTVNLRNMNPFRSLSNQFTLAGFLSSLNPMLTAPFQAAGFRTLSGSGQLYPEITYDPTTGQLVAAHPKGGPWTAAEAFVPELGVIDALTGQSDQFRSLLSSGDSQATWRELNNLLNIPFTVSQYNIPNTRARVAKDELTSAKNAVTQFEKTGDFEGTIGRYNLIPYQGRLIPPEQLQAYWQQLTARYAQQYPGASVRAVLPKTTAPKVNTLAELLTMGAQP